MKELTEVQKEKTITDLYRIVLTKNSVYLWEQEKGESILLMASSDILLLQKSYYSFIGFIESNADTEDTKEKVMFVDLYEQVLIAQDAVIELMEQKIELQKHLNSTDERIIKWEKKVKELKNKIDNIEEDIAKESGYEKEDNTIQITNKK